MIKYNNNTINDWNFGTSNLIKVYRNNAIVFYKVSGESPTPSQTPCFAVVDDISQYSDTEFDDVFDNATEKWYKLNNLNQFEEYGVYGSGRTITYYEGKLTIDNGYEYQYSGNSWVNVGEVSGSTYLEYIERNSTYNGYIPLGEYFTENTVIQMDFQMTQAKGNAIIGDYGSNDNDDWRVFINYDSQVNNLLNYDFDYSRGDYNTGDWSQRFNIEIGNYYIKDLNTGSYLINSDSRTGFSRPNQMYLFHMEGSQTQNNIDYGHIYSVKIYQNNVLVKDYIPWTDGNGNYGLYDNVSSSATQSIDSMTGHVHSDIVYPIYYSEMQDPPNNVSFSSMTEAESYECPWWGMTGIIDNTDYLFCDSNEWLTKYAYQEVSGDYICDSGNKYKKMQEYDRNVDGTISATTNYIMGDLIESASTDCSSRLPSGYTEVEYLENVTPNKAYIDTNFAPNQNTRVIADLQYVDTNTHPRAFGCGTWDGMGYVFNAENGIPGEWRWKFGYTSGWLTTGIVSDFNRHKVEINNGNLYLDDVNIGSTTVTTFQLADNIGLFGFIYNGTLGGADAGENMFGKFYSFKIYDNGTLVRDLVPCTRDSDSKTGMYDIVNNVFYSSANSYNFVAGNPI